jgi:hypothetical protein
VRELNTRSITRICVTAVHAEAERDKHSRDRKVANNDFQVGHVHGVQETVVAAIVSAGTHTRPPDN